MKSNLVLCLALVVIGGLIAFANSAHSNPIADRPQSNQSFHALEFDSIHMIDRENGWARNARAVLLLQEFLRIPVPLAVAPVAYFLAAAVLTSSLVFAFVSTVFGFAHVYLFWKELHCCLNQRGRTMKQKRWSRSRLQRAIYPTPN